MTVHHIPDETVSAGEERITNWDKTVTDWKQMRTTKGFKLKITYIRETMISSKVCTKKKYFF